VTGLDRREFLKAGAAGALILGGVPVDGWARRGRRALNVPFAAGGAFAEGLAAGAPKPRGIQLWTRLSGAGTGDRRLRLEVARDRDFRRTVVRRDVVARAARDGTVRVRVEGRRLLAPGEEYFYRFETGGSHSEIGRFRTLLPPDSREPVRIAFFSCQDWQAGYFGAHTAIAAEPDIDVVICLGDYIYERNFYTGPRQDTLGANRDGEVQTLDEYRAKYRFYKSDADLRAMHAAHPFVGVWDDHEVEDNYARDKPGTETQQVRVPFLQRRANGYRAWDEFMPFDYVGRGTRIYRSFRVGRNAEVFLLDQRQYRDDQPCNDSLTTPCPEAETQPRKYLGDAQKAWFKRSLQGSGARWKVVANQLMVMSLDAPNGVALNKDSWDGYGVERREVMDHVRAKRIRDLAFVTGDIHLFGAGEVGPNGRGPESLATEFVGGSITSKGAADAIQDEYGAPVPPQVGRTALGNIQEFNPHIKQSDQEAHGYGVLEARDGELLVRFVAVPVAPTRSTQARTLARFRVPAGTPRVQVL
jgi:alkaline phosphatase D